MAAPTTNFTHPRPGAFTRSMRLVHAKEFQAVYGYRLRKISPPLVVFVMPNERRVSRLGLSINKRHGPAVKRNWWKRLIRDAFRADPGGLAGPQGGCLDCVVQVAASDAEPSVEELTAALQAAAQAGWREIARRARRAGQEGL